MVAGSAADAATSWGKYEMNPVLGNQGFGVRAMVLKGAILGTAIVVERRFTTRHPEGATVMNFGMAGVLAAAAVHNSRIGKLGVK